MVYFVNLDGRHGEDFEHMFRSYSAAESFYNGVTSASAAYKSLCYDDAKRGTITVMSEVLIHES